VVVSGVGAIPLPMHLLPLRLTDSHCFVVSVLRRADLRLRIVRILLLDTASAFLGAQRLVTCDCRRSDRFIRAAHPPTLDMAFALACVVGQVGHVRPLHRYPAVRQLVSRTGCDVGELHQMVSTDDLPLAIEIDLIAV